MYQSQHYQADITFKNMCESSDLSMRSIDNMWRSFQSKGFIASIFIIYKVFSTNPKKYIISISTEQIYRSLQGW